MKTLILFSIFFLSVNSHAEQLGDLNFKLNASGRVRGEGSDNKDFTNTIEDKNNFIGSRFRISLDVQNKKTSSVFINIDHTGTWGANSGVTRDGNATIHQAYLKHNFNDSIQLKLGRQEFLYGDELLVGPLGWSNVGRSFDAFKTTWTHKLGWVDLFVADVSKTSNGVTTNDHYFSGVYSHFNLQSIDNLEFYIFNTQDPANSTEERAVHYGTRLKSKAGLFDYRFEATGQSVVEGNQADLELGYSFSNNKPTRLSLEVFTSSKDFIQLFPTAHKWLGTGDFLSRRNISGLRVGTSHFFFENIKAKVDYHMFQRTEADLPAYNFPGAAIGNVGSNKNIGSELDLNVNVPIDEVFSITFGGARFFVGDYLKDNNLTSDGSFFYLQTYIKL